MRLAKYLIMCLIVQAIAFDSNLLAQGKVSWMSWEEAYTANQKEPRKIFVDVYTDWCGWCKKMDVSTFVNPVIVNILNTDFYAVKLDAEMKDSVEFKGHIFFNPDPQSRRSVHTLAASLLDNKLSYPSFVLLNEEYARLQIIPGYKDALAMEPIITFYGENVYLEKSYEEFNKSFEPKVKK